jgi:hypothetical protein
MAEHRISGAAWLYGGRIFCSKQCAGGNAIPFAFGVGRICGEGLHRRKATSNPKTAKSKPSKE